MTLAITYRRYGDPTETLEVTYIGEPPQAAPGQVQVEVSALPIHPGDLLAISAARIPGGQLIAGVEATGVVHRRRRRGHRFQPKYPGHVLSPRRRVAPSRQRQRCSRGPRA